MPSASHPQAQFVPIPPDFDLSALVENTSNFDYVTRLSMEKLKEHSIQSFEALVLAVVIQSGKPLVIEDWGSTLPFDLFSKDWLEQNLGTKPEKVRDIPNEVDIPMTMGHYLRSMGQLTKQFTASNYRDPKRQRLYLKDIDCPEPWAQHLEHTIPESVYYLNECIESRTGGDGAVREPNEYGQMRYGKGVAPAGDLMSSLPPEMRALNMMCYIGHEGTYTPAHREMCASLGQNIMVEASENRNGEKAGSSIWFMTETKELEKHFAQVNAWKKAPFNVWVVEQKVGDLILIPPLAPHQVWNRGTRTMKVAWNRTTVDTLELAIHEALPRARMVCRDEQYKNKAIIYYTLVKYHDLLQRDTIEPKMWKYGRIKQLLDDFKRLFLLYTEILVSDMFSPKLPEYNVEFLPYDSNVTCSYCRCNIFNRFLTCKSCIEYGPNGEEDTYDICMDCFAMGRSCACISNLNWVEQWEWTTLLQNYEQWRNIVVQSDGFFDVQRSPQPLDIARKRYGKKPIAEVCQEQLKIRPWNDPKNPTAREPSPGMSDVEPEVDDAGRPKNKRRSKFSKAGKGRVAAEKNKTHACHVCCHHDWNWRLAFCTTCKNAYCYGVLWRGFDLMPQTVMEDKDWQCPKCLKICSCGKCRKSDTQKPYSPKGTLLGHDTKRVADFRSVESLVDFSKTNLGWLRGEEDNPHETSRMKKLKEKAEAEKARVDTAHESYLDDGGQQDPSLGAPAVENGAGDMDDIDPALRDTGMSISASAHTNGHYGSPYKPADPTINGANMNHDNSDADQSIEWDEHYEIDDYDSYNHQGASHASRLSASEANQTAPIASMAPMVPMFAPTSSYPDPSHVAHNRMMGAGYYQQGDGVDRILYDPPNSDESIDESSQPGPAFNVNMALSDLLEPPLDPVENTKKRKRLGKGMGSGDEDDLEFFTSKKAKKLAKSKMMSQLTKAPATDVTQNKPRRSAVKPMVYEDLGEDSVPIDDDEGPSTLSGSHKRRNSNKPDDDLDTAAQALRRLSKPPVKKEAAAPKRRSIRTHPEGESGSLALVASKPKPPRKSAWLARKEAQERKEEFPDEVPARTRRGRPRKAKTSPALDLFSGSEDNDDGVVDIETNSIFGEPIEKEKSVTSSGSEASANTPNNTGSNDEDGEHGIKWRASNIHPSVKVVEVESRDKPAPKRRGRPPKQAPARIRSPSPETTTPAPIPKLLSLKEKLALKGKAAKIVAAKPQTPVGGNSVAASSRSTPSISVTIPQALKEATPTDSSRSKTSTEDHVLRSPSPPSPVEWASVNKGYATFRTTEQPRSATGPTSFKLSDVRGPAAASAPSPPQPVRKGPTVVRLMSPDSESEYEAYVSDARSASLSISIKSEGSGQGDSSDDSDASIPAVQAPKQSRGVFPFGEEELQTVPWGEAAEEEDLEAGFHSRATDKAYLQPFDKQSS
ncbi:hypothetical protein G7Y89_g6829 [Cudoniella acicularis]|uniref:JmjC domain-containing protein n=1 Tax=Cudoniella acicularis TaxID=354080 RepID=A0A8H4W2N1_9HELO|nr:hypothetical protein G7Y89_g6829 [Cudoniella acicularis]